MGRELYEELQGFHGLMHQHVVNLNVLLSGCMEVTAGPKESRHISIHRIARRNQVKQFDSFPGKRQAAILAWSSLDPVGVGLVRLIRADS